MKDTVCKAGGLFSGSNRKKVLIGVFVLLICIGLGVIGFLVYKKQQEDAKKKPKPAPKKVATQRATVVEDVDFSPGSSTLKSIRSNPGWCRYGRLT